MLALFQSESQREMTHSGAPPIWTNPFLPRVIAIPTTTVRCKFSEMGLILLQLDQECICQPA